jgi:glycosyltransferase involved in cell wall biosynthesis
LKALNKLLTDGKLRLKLGKNARRKILKDLTIRKTAAQTVKTYRQLLAGKD